LVLARKNEKLADSYETAQNYINNGDFSAAKAELRFLQEDAPYYGDPAGLMQRLELDKPLKWPTDFDKEEEQKRAAKMPITSRFIKDILITNIAIVCITNFYLLSGFSVICGLLTRPWLWTPVATILIGTLAYVLGYRRAMPPIAIGIVSVASSIIASYSVNYVLSVNKISQLTWFWNESTSTGTQINFGLLCGLIAGITCCIGTCWHAFNKSALRPKGVFVWPLLALLIGIVTWSIIGLVTRQFKLDPGFGDEWYSGLITWVALMIGGTGLGNSLYVWVQALRHP